VTKDKGLTDVTLAEAVENRFRDRVFTVGDAVNDRRAFAREVVSVRTIAKRKLAARVDDAAVGRNLQRLGHGRVQLFRLFGVTLDAGFISDITNAASIGVRSPGGEEVVSLRSRNNEKQATGRADDNKFTDSAPHLRPPLCTY